MFHFLQNNSPGLGQKFRGTAKWDRIVLSIKVKVKSIAFLQIRLGHVVTNSSLVLIQKYLSEQSRLGNACQVNRDSKTSVVVFGFVCSMFQH